MAETTRAPSRRLTHNIVATTMGASLAALGITLFYWAAPEAHLGLTFTTISLTLCMIALFAAADMGQLHVEVRKVALSVSLSGAPFALSLFLLPPYLFFFARITGAIISLCFKPRPPSRLAFNLGLFTLEVGVSLAALTFFDPIEPLHPLSWAAVVIAVLATDLVSMIMVLSAMRIMGSSVALTDFLSSLTTTCASSLFGTALGVIGAAAYSLNRWGLALLVVVYGSMVYLLGAHHRLNERHKITQRLYSFTQSEAAVGTSEDVVGVLLGQAKSLTKAGSAVLHSSAWRDWPGGMPDDPQPLIVGRRSRQPGHQEWLRRNNIRDAILIPVRQDRQIVGFLQVCDRLGEVDTFTAENLEALRTMVAHVEVVWHNTALLDQLRQDARHDHLTGLDNRVQLQDKLAALLASPASSRALRQPTERQADGTEDCIGGLVLLDVSLHAAVSDALGQQVADRLLIHVAAQLDERLPEDCTIARAGDDLFAVLLPACHHEADVLDWIGQIRAALAEPLETQGMTLDPAPRIGYALLPQDGPTPDAAVQNAHVALVSARKDHRNERPARYRRSESDLSRYRLALAGELRHGIADQQITVLYQPKVRATAAQEVVGFEALARWEHPKRGLIMPDEFIPLAENTGQLTALTESVLCQALDRASQWLLSYESVGISVNLSARQLLDPTLPTMMANMLARFAVPPQMLTLEITESKLMAEPDAARAAMDELRSLGVRLSVDDFGTGYSSLSYLQSLPLDEVKIDKSFILRLTRATENHEIVRAIIELVHVLGMTVVAEGVETTVVRDLLAQDGCDVIQGFLIGRGIPSDGLIEWLTTWERHSTSLSGT